MPRPFPVVPDLTRGLAISLALLPLPALAQTETSVRIGCNTASGPEGDITAIGCATTDITVTATGVAQIRDQSGLAISSFTSDPINQRQLTSLADLLATSPGITVTRNGGPGQPTAVRIRGAEDSQTLTLIDGVRVNDSASPAGAFDFGNLLTGNIARIEVLRGPNSVRWGSQAIGGVVNIVTPGPPQRRSGSATAEYGYNNSKQLVGQIGDRFGAVSASIGGGYFNDDGISAYKNGSERDGYRQYAGNARVDVDLGEVSLDLRGYFADSKVQFDGYAPPSFNFGDTANYSKTQQRFGYTGIHTEQLGIKHRLAFSLSDTARDSFGGPNMAPIFIARGRTERFEYQGDAEISQTIRAVFGLEHETSRFRDDFSRYATGVISGYAQAIFTPVNQLTLTGGVRLDDHRAYGTKATVSANAAWRIGGSTILRASYGEGFKAPTLYQLFSDYGNTGLRPETAQSYDIGVEQRLIGDTLTLGLTAFHRDTSDQIDFSFAPRANRPFGFYDNIARARSQGLEFTLLAQPSRTLTLTANYTLTDAKDHTTGLVLLRRPKHSLNASVDWSPKAWLKLGASVQTISDSADLDFVTFTPTTLDGYTLATLRASISLGERFELFGRIENLFDAKYETVSGYGTNGRNAHIGVRTKF